jgi:mono/diheme cytochrome c family protein
MKKNNMYKNLFATMSILLIANTLLSAEGSEHLDKVYAQYLSVGKTFLIILASSVVIFPILAYFLHINKKRRNGEKVSYIGERLSRNKSDRDELLDHNYDGIMELDNSMPPWLKYMFNFTIAFAVFYVFHYLFLGTGDLQTKEYEDQIAEGNKQVAEFMIKNVNSVDETNAKLSKIPEILAKGKVVFDKNCVVCHGAGGQGTVGPNFTDDYWISGGDIKAVFKTIKYGKPDKGMKSWKTDLSAAEMYQVACFIKSLKGTNPANPKDKQGDLYTGE